MRTYKPNLILSILVLIVSFLSILVINKQVFAAWYYPQAAPPDTSLDNHFIFNPATEDFNLDGNDLVGVGQLCLGVDCRSAWPAGGGSGDGVWRYGSAPDYDLYYTTGTGSGYVGIGTSDANKLLHLYKNSGDNAELDIQSTAGANNHWGIYQDRASKDLRFWQGNDRVIFADTGEVGIGIQPVPNVPLYVNTGTGNAALISNNTYSGFGGGIGIIGLGTVAGLTGSSAVFGVQGTSASTDIALGAAIYGINSSGGLAAKFDGPVALNGNTAVNDANYFKISSLKNAPPAGDCTVATSDTGKLFYAWGAAKIYICDRTGVWKSIQAL